MKLTDSILSILLFSSLFMSCQEDECLSAQNADRPSDESRTVDLAFCFSGEQRENRNVDNDIATEEGEVNNLIYAVFQNMTLRKREFVPLSEEDYNTANGKKYIVHGVDNQYLDGHSEIFAAANVSDEMKEKLMSENPDYEVPDDDPIILRLVEEQIKHEAYVYVCDNFLLPNNYASEMIPKDGKVHYFPANTNNYVSKQWDMTVLPDTWRFKTYAEFEKKKDDQNMPSEIRDIYKEIEIDLQCRVPCYKQPEYDKKRAELADKEKQDHVIRDGIKRELKQYMLWKNYAFRSDLNEEASRNDSRLIEKPLMAGYYALEGTFGTVITVPVEHVYTRIWFDFLLQDALFTVSQTRNGSPIDKEQRVDGKTYYILLNKMNADAFRDYINVGELSEHTHEQKQNWLYREYHIAKNMIGYRSYDNPINYDRHPTVNGVPRTWYQVTGVWSDNKFDINSPYYYRGEQHSLAFDYNEDLDGSDIHHWRIPNLREAAIMSMAFPESWFPHGTEQEPLAITSGTVSDNLGQYSTNLPFWIISSGQIQRLPSNSKYRFYVRPIRDVK